MIDSLVRDNARPHASSVSFSSAARDESRVYVCYHRWCCWGCCAPEESSRVVLLLGGVPLAGQLNGEAISNVGDEAGGVGHPAEHVGRVAVGSEGGGSASECSGSRSDGGQGGAAALWVDRT